MNLDELAPLKINLFLHITGRRADGYHLLQSLFVFADFGDRISYTPSDAPLSLEIVGPFAGALQAGPDNLVLRAARLLRDFPTGRLQLDKQLPVASGLGGGSADAAATLRLLNRVWRCGLPDAELRAIGSKLGADIPACIASQPCYVSGIGDELHDAGASQSLPLLLVNPRIATATPAVFAAYRDLASPFSPPLAGWPSPTLPWQQCQNDLTVAAIALVPDISIVLQLLNKFEFVQNVRMSGSGASCFAVFATPEAAVAAAGQMQILHPNWWTQVVMVKVPAIDNRID